MTDLPALSYAEDLTAGDTLALGSYTVSEEELVEFATQWDPQAHHIDYVRAEAGAYGGIIASGVHTIAVFQRLAVLAVFNRVAVIAGRDLGPIRFLRPVRPGSKLIGTAVIDSVEHDERNRALVTLRGTLSENDSGKDVLDLTMTFYVHARPEH